MSGSLFWRLTTCVMLCALVAAPAWAQDQERSTSTGYNAILDNLDLLVDNYAKFLARKYDLTEEQDRYTKYLLQERANAFLQKNEDQLRGLIDRMFEVRSGGEMTPEDLIAWGTQAAPLYEEAKRTITEGNTEWREILTPEQKKIHDEDLRLMQQSFETTEEQLNRILSGDMTVEEFRSPYRANRGTRARQHNPAPPANNPGMNEPPMDEPIPVDEPSSMEEPQFTPAPGEQPRMTPADRAAEQAGAHQPNRKPENNRNTRVSRGSARVDRSGERGQAVAPNAPQRGREPGVRNQPAGAQQQKPETEWEKYVREFIEKYKLDEQQSQKARAILDDCEQQKERYLTGKKDEIELVDKQIAEMQKSTDKNKAKNVAKLNERKQKLSEPVNQIFEQQLKPRLERLPTRAQRRDAEAGSKKKPEPKKVQPAPPMPPPEPEPEPQEPEPEPDPNPDDE